MDLYDKDLGTMGVPREIQSQYDFMNVINQNGGSTDPAVYEPQRPQKHLQTSLFGLDK